jgi:hypothetical protein
MGHIAPARDIMISIATNKPDVLFLSLTLISSLPSAKQLLLKIRDEAPQVKLVLGGHAAVLASKTLANYADVIAHSIEEAHTLSLKLVGTNA